MAAILDYCVPSRRRERIERKEQRALTSRVDSRWGDAQISAPTQAGWNQPGYVSAAEMHLPSLPAHESPRLGSSVATTPDLSSRPGAAAMRVHGHNSQASTDATAQDRKNITFTISLPWPSKKGNGATPPIPEKDRVFSRQSPDLVLRPQTAPSNPPVLYKPVSDQYLNDLAAMGGPSRTPEPPTQNLPDRSDSASPIVVVPPKLPGLVTSVGSVASVGEVGFSPVPYSRGASPVSLLTMDTFTSTLPPPIHHAPSPVQIHPASSIMRLETIPATPYCVDGFSEDAHAQVPPVISQSQYDSMERRARARSTSRGPSLDRTGVLRSSSRDPDEDRASSIRSASRGPADRLSYMRSSSRGPDGRSASRGRLEDQMHSMRSSSRGAEERMGVRSSSRGAEERMGVRSSSRGAEERMGMRSSSRGAEERMEMRSSSRGAEEGMGMRSSSRGPVEERYSSMRAASSGLDDERIGTTRASSRSPGEDRIGTPRERSRGPPLERDGLPRPSSREPGLDRFPNSRSSSVPPVMERIGAPRSSSRGPARDREGYESSLARGPPDRERSRPRSSSVGPLGGRMALARSGSKEPTADGVFMAQRDSLSSQSSSSTIFSDDDKSNFTRSTSKHTTPEIGTNPGAAAIIGAGGGGYYTSLTNEYRQITKDIEIQAAVSDSDGSEGKEKRGAREKVKEKAREMWTVPTELVPSSTDLYG